jgi:hypothetical protein
MQRAHKILGFKPKKQPDICQAVILMLIAAMRR